MLIEISPVILKSIHVAIAESLFEGLATNSLLHYALAAIYVQSDDEQRISQLMRTSLALYMLSSRASRQPELRTRLWQ
ncbi:hypothetical protein F5Y02DRAFT_404145 [Annulohypoxylon stygium]|nr:hypothetical protein F5Y02DRAFT_404145 [Annulohypoxylon stygium]